MYGISCCLIVHVINSITIKLFYIICSQEKNLFFNATIILLLFYKVIGRIKNHIYIPFQKYLKILEKYIFYILLTMR